MGAAKAGRATPGADVLAWFEAAADLTDKNRNETLLISATRLGVEASCLWDYSGKKGCRQNGPVPLPADDECKGHRNRGLGRESGFVIQHMERVFGALGMVAPTRSGDVRASSKARNKNHLDSQQYYGYTKGASAARCRSTRRRCACRA